MFEVDGLEIYDVLRAAVVFIRTEFFLRASWYKFYGDSYFNGLSFEQSFLFWYQTLSDTWLRGL